MPKYHLVDDIKAHPVELHSGNATLLQTAVLVRIDTAESIEEPFGPSGVPDR